MKCNICPRMCNVDRAEQRGFCNMGINPVVSKYTVHMWEEPPISGIKGSGAVFFTGCNLRCAFCQNYKISQECSGEEISVARLADIFLILQDKGVHNINLVTPSHFILPIADSIGIAKKHGLCIPVVYNTNAYEKIESLKLLEGLIDIYLPDIKYFDDETAKKYSCAENYFDTATRVVLEMNRQVGTTVIDENGIMLHGLIIRHLVLPNYRRDSMKILDWIKANIPSAYVSLMSQYIPIHKAKEFEKINRRLTTFEYESVKQYFFTLGLSNGFMQNRNSATEEYIPNF